MRRWWRSHSVRVQLTLWYVVAMVIVLGLYATLIFAFVRRNASDTLDGRLRGDFQWAAAMVDQTPDGAITWYEDLLEEDSPWLQVWSPEGDLLYQNSETIRRPLPGTRDLALLAEDAGAVRTRGAVVPALPYYAIDQARTELPRATVGLAAVAGHDLKVFRGLQA